MKRLFDIIFATILLVLLFFPMLLISMFVLFTSKGSSVYWSKRVGKENVLFKMPKFRSMYIETPDVASHLLENPDMFLTPIGSFLRSTSLDELPQLFSIIKGDMSFVGPRPALFNQEDLIALRTEMGINLIVPGVTGLAQINGRDDLTIIEKVKFDEEYLYNKSFRLDLKILYLTVRRVISSQGISH